MDYLFLFLLSTGFVGGLFASLKKSAKSFIVLFLTFSIFAIIFEPFVNFIISRQFFKYEIFAFVKEKFAHINFLWQEVENVEGLCKLLELSHLPTFVSNMFIQLCKKKTSSFFLGEVLIDALYNFFVIVVVAIVVFLTLYIALNVIFGLAFFRFKGGGDMFVTKRVASGVVGGMKGVMAFVAIEVVIVFLCELFGLSFLQTYVKESSVMSVGYEYLLGHIEAFIGEVFY